MPTRGGVAREQAGGQRSLLLPWTATHQTQLTPSPTPPTPAQSTPTRRLRTRLAILIRLQQRRHVGVGGQQRQDLHLAPQVLQVNPPPQLALAAPARGGEDGGAGGRVK